MPEQRLVSLGLVAHAAWSVVALAVDRLVAFQAVELGRSRAHLPRLAAALRRQKLYRVGGFGTVWIANLHEIAC